MALFSWGRRALVLKRAEEILSECCRQMGLGEKEFGGSAREWIARRKWSGDLSEMRRWVYYAALAATGPTLEAAHFPLICRSDHEAYTKKQFDALSLEDVVGHKLDHFFGKIGQLEIGGLYDVVTRQVEKPLIERCLKWASGNQLKAARVLGINRNTLRKKIKDLGIKPKTSGK